MTTSNAINANSTGLVRYNGTGTFDAVTVTNHATLVGAASNGITSLGLGTSGQVLTSNGAGADPSYQTAPSGVFAPNSVMNIFDDFIGYHSDTSNQSPYQWNYSWMSGTSNSPIGTGLLVVNTNPGVVENLSTTSGWGPALGLSNGTIAQLPIFRIGAGTISLNYVINVRILSDVTNTYTAFFGLSDTAASVAPVNGIFFSYTNAVNSGRWVMNTEAASSPSTSNTTTTVSAGAWVNLGITINAAASLITYFINGVSVGTLNTTIPATSVSLAPTFGFRRSLGTIAANTLSVDLFYMTQTFTTPR